MTASCYRSHTCGELRALHENEMVTLSGWVHKVRNLGSMIFLDLRDRYGITQAIFDPKVIDQAVYEMAKNLKLESVVSLSGKVLLRQSKNPHLPTGDIELQAVTCTILSEAAVPPFPIADQTMDVHEELRLKYRYLDMRKGSIIQNLILRHTAMQATRRALSEEGFTEVSTPILGKSTPEGARDYLVPSRVHTGHFYALPQSPQMFKQLLMVGGLDRYFQIATCFRDEDLRADRQPEFQQIDIEMSFATCDELFPAIERLLQRVFKESKDVEIKAPFQRMTYRDAMENYGCDKPDLRFGMPLIDASDLSEKTSFSVFLDIVRSQGIVRGIVVKGGARLSRKELDQYASIVQQFGLKGLSWLKCEKEGLQGPISKFIDDSKSWIERFQVEENDCILLVAGPKKRALQALDQLRRRVAKDFQLIKEGDFAPLWVVDFPLFTWNEEEKRIESEHHPFTSPHLQDLHLLDTDPLKARSSSYDLVLNGYELASGSQRIHDQALQAKIFSIIGFSEEERREKFGFFIESLSYGTPPHLGIALGFDRLAMILLGTENIRDVVAFPKNQKAIDLMTDAPSKVLPSQLHELKLRVD